MKQNKDLENLERLTEVISKMSAEELETHGAEILEHLRAIPREEKTKQLWSK